MTGSDLLSKYLRREGLTRTAFGHRAGLITSMVSHYCNGTRRPGRDAAIAIEEATAGSVPAKSWSGAGRGAATRRQRVAS